MSGGLCECGCGQRTRLAPQTRAARGWRKGEPKRFLPGHQARVVAGRLAASHRWKGGRHIDADGYVLLYRPEHPRANHGYVFEHILVVEAAMGRFLPVRAQVHHVNEVRSDNLPGNLVACDSLAYHKLLHKRMRALAACGNPSAHRCVYCHTYDDQEAIHLTTGGRAYHARCANEANQRRIKERSC